MRISMPKMSRSTAILVGLGVFAIILGLLLWRSKTVNTQPDLSQVATEETVEAVEGTVGQTFVSARAFTILTADGREVSAAIDDSTEIRDAANNEVPVENFSLALTPGTKVSTIVDMTEDDTGVAILVITLAE